MGGESVVQQCCHTVFPHKVFVTHCLFKVLDTGRVTPVKLSFVIYLSRKPQFTLNVWFPMKSCFYFQMNLLRHKKVNQLAKGYLVVSQWLVPNHHLLPVVFWLVGKSCKFLGLGFLGGSVWGFFVVVYLFTLCCSSTYLFKLLLHGNYSIKALHISSEFLQIQ